MTSAHSHIHTQALIDAWRRLGGEGDLDAGARITEHPGLVDNLFVLGWDDEGRMHFRNVGAGVERMFARELVSHDFRSLWQGEHHLTIMECAAEAMATHKPLVIRAHAMTLSGAVITLEFTLAPIRNTVTKGGRFLGLCQDLGSQSASNARPVGPLQLVAAGSPAAGERPPSLRLVVSND